MLNAAPDGVIFDLAPFPMWIYDLESFRFLAVNKEAIRHYGYSEEEFLNMTIRDIRPKEDIPKLEKAVEAAKRRIKLYKESLFRHKKRDGNIMYVQIKSNLINFKGKKAEIVTAIDLTDRYETEQKIEAQKEYLKAIDSTNHLLLKSENWLESLNTSFKVVGETMDIDRIYFFQNNLKKETTSQRIEWSRDNIKSQIDNPELQNIPFSQFPLFMEPLRRNSRFEAIVKDLPPSPTKDILIQQDIKSILVLPLWIDDNFCGFIGFDDCRRERNFSEDEYQVLNALTSNLGHVIKRQEAYQELSDREARFKSLIENGQDLIAIIDQNGNYKYVASTSKTVLGISPEEFIGKNAFEFIHDEDIPRLQEQLAEISQSKYVSIAPYRFPDGKGNWRWIRTELSNHLDTPFIEGIVANTQEVTAEVKKGQIDKLVASLAMTIGQPGSLSSCLCKAMSQLVKLNNINVSEIWLVSKENSRLDLISGASQEKTFELFRENSKGVTSFVNGTGLPGHVWKENRTAVWEDISNHKSYIRIEAAELANLNTGAGFPITYNNEFIGCITCFSAHRKDELTEEFSILTEVTQQLGPVIKQKIIEDEYRNFFDISPDPHCIIGFDGCIKKYNKAFVKLLGYHRKDLLSKPIFQFIHEEDRQESKEELRALEKGDPAVPYKVRLITSQGDVKWLLWSGKAVPESKIIIAVGKDITEQTVAEQELHETYKRLKTAQKIAQLGYWLRDFDSEVSIWSDETYRIYECSQQTFTPTMENIIQTFHPDDRYLIKSDPTEHLEPGKVTSFEHRILTPRGNVKWVRQEIRLLTDEYGTPFRIEGTIQDITERKEYEEQISLSNERFRLAMQASTEVIWDVDMVNQKLIRVKDRRQTIDYELCEEFSIDNSWFTSIAPNDREKVWNSLHEALQDKNQKFWNTEYSIIADDGSVFYFVDRCYILRNKNGEPLRLVGAALDVTASRQQLEKIKEQNENLREIAWLQSHVIRAPLSRIMGLIYLANELGGGGISQKEIMDLITTSANELDDVIRKISDKTNLVKDEDERNITDRRPSTG